MYHHHECFLQDECLNGWINDWREKVQRMGIKNIAYTFVATYMYTQYFLSLVRGVSEIACILWYNKYLYIFSVFSSHNHHIAAICIFSELRLFGTLKNIYIRCFSFKIWIIYCLPQEKSKNQTQQIKTIHNDAWLHRNAHIFIIIPQPTLCTTTKRTTTKLVTL